MSSVEKPLSIDQCRRRVSVLERLSRSFLSPETREELDLRERVLSKLLDAVCEHGFYTESRRDAQWRRVRLMFKLGEMAQFVVVLNQDFDGGDTWLSVKDKVGQYAYQRSMLVMMYERGSSEFVLSHSFSIGEFDRDKRLRFLNDLLATEVDLKRTQALYETIKEATRRSRRFKVGWLSQYRPNMG